MREIVLDTETTGFEPSEGHRLVEIGCVELVNHVATGQTFHKYINPEREVPEEAARVHGLTWDMLKDKPLFSDVAAEFLDFIGDSPLIIHNAAFDMKFINAELAWAGFATVPFDRAIDTVQMARRKFPGAPASLDALCRRFGIDNSHREKHGALLDSELLAEVYLELRGGRQPGLVLTASTGPVTTAVERMRVDRPYRAPRPHAPSAGEQDRHRAFLAKKVKGALWETLLPAKPEDGAGSS
ncbi:DNA polymerase III subunit epsilon [Novispirillum itersonii]|uniref:DNA polymerase III subunit epsilon n=1 Tax=Novispirillum itersonii TaxID=189 RepID=A0A7X0DL79_NOVIT|nr:DNA polymerase III subunit epsilon [Novispirillum itersonii]MBB6209748.1 DNA polymerase-3 subunit epsilon [Novispirillum itersonii]